MANCKHCNGTGVIETGNNDLPCSHCEAGKSALFNDASLGTVTGEVLLGRWLTSSWFASLDQDSKKTLICLLFELRGCLEDGDSRHDLYLELVRHLYAEYHALKMSPRERARESWRNWDAEEIAREVAHLETDVCDRDVFENGHMVCVLDACMYRAEQWVRAVAQESGQKVDWHYVGGRSVVKFLGDRNKVTEAVEMLEPDLGLTPVKTRTHRCRCSGPKHDACHMLRIVFPADEGGGR